jgi:hypothetical protein
MWRRRPKWLVQIEGHEAHVREQVARDLEALRDIYLERTDLDAETVRTLLDDAAKVTRQGYGHANVWEAEAWS